MDAFKQGLSAAFSGMGMALGDRGVRRAYARLILAIVVVSGVLDVAGLWSLWHFTVIDPGTPAWQASLSWVARVLGTVVVLVAAPVLGILLTNVTLPMFNERSFMAGMRAVDSRRAAELSSLPGNPLHVSIGIGAARVGLFVVGTTLCLGFGLVPVVGNVLAPILGGWFAASIVGWELLEPYFDRLGLRWAAQRQFLKRHRWAVLGFAVPISLLLAVPLVGPVFFGVAQAGAAWFVRRVLEGVPAAGGAGASTTS